MPDEKPTMPCRDCQRPVRWGVDVKDPKGPRCWDCAAAYREQATARAAARTDAE